MRILKSPKVYLIARPQIAEEGFRAFLEDQKLDWPTPINEVKDAERLVEIAGRCCYMSFGKKAGSKTNKKYVQNLVGRNDDGSFKPGPAHGCYDGDTEVLTKGGWKKWCEVSYQDELATRNRDGNIEYHYPKRLIQYYHEGEMFFANGQQVNLLVTPNHKMLATLTTTCEGRRREGYKLIDVSELENVSHAYIKVANWQGDDEEYENIASLLGFTIGDGNLTNDFIIRFHLKRERKIKYLYDLVNELKLKINIPSKDVYSITIPHQWRDLFREIYSESDEKQIPSKLLFCGKKTLLNLFDGLINSDGSIYNGHTCYDTTSYKLADQMQQLCLHIGRVANFVYVYRKQQRSNSFGNKDLIRLSIPTTGLHPELNRKSFKNKAKLTKVYNWSGNVYCAEVPNNTLFVRRNGIPIWSGNSVCEHPCWSFLIVGAGRGFSHEQVRHRTGWAYSQLSTRYCDFEREEEEGTWEPGFCIPPLSQLSSESADLFAEKIKKSQEAYCDLLAVIETDLKNNKQFMDTLAAYDEKERKRMLRKAARGAARDILPIATEAIMVMSANARAIWNCIYLRANEHAEAVIREIYVQISKIMEKEMPALFNGIAYEKCWDGTEVVVMPRDKL